MLLELHAMSVLSPLRSPGAKAVQLYWVVAIASTLLSTWVGSLSEYRFPHTLLTTSLHLSFALAPVVVLSSLTPRSPSTRSRQLTSSPSNGPRRTSDSLLLPRPLSLSTILSPVAVSTVVSAQISALYEDSLASVAEQPFMSFIRILPIFFFICLPLKGSASWPRITATLLGLVLGAGPAVRINGGSLTAWWRGGGWAFSTCVWALGLHAGLGVETHQTVEPEERQTTEATPTGTGSTPRLNLPIYLGGLLLFNLTLLVFSGEVGRASSSGHFGFFTSAGFWIQELVMAWCSLARLVAFWNLFHVRPWSPDFDERILIFLASMVQHLDPLSILLVTSVKDFLLPLATSFIFGNPLSTQEETGSALTTWQQALIIAGVGWSALSEGQAGMRKRG